MWEDIPLIQWSVQNMECLEDPSISNEMLGSSFWIFTVAWMLSSKCAMDEIQTDNHPKKEIQANLSRCLDLMVIGFGAGGLTLKALKLMNHVATDLCL